MNNQKIRNLVIAFCAAAAGICCSCGREPVFIPADRGSLLSGTESFEESGGMEQAKTGTKPESSTSAPCYVHICGEVARPGVYEMEAGSRIYQVVEKAGGFTNLAAGDYLNMAGPVEDGMKLVVPSLDQLDGLQVYGEGGTDGSQGGAGENRSKVNINTAGKEQLMTLKGIGESRAEDIINYRESHGGFSAVEDIMNVSGIKEAAFRKIKDDITV